MGGPPVSAPHLAGLLANGWPPGCASAASPFSARSALHPAFPVYIMVLGTTRLLCICSFKCPTLTNEGGTLPAYCRRACLLGTPHICLPAAIEVETETQDFWLPKRCTSVIL